MMIKFINDIVVPIWGLLGIGKTKIAYIAIQRTGIITNFIQWKGGVVLNVYCAFKLDLKYAGVQDSNTLDTLHASLAPHMT